eukprot:SAG11_NODE_5907_length_1437_cov_1.091928_1_plen_147_part_10
MTPSEGLQVPDYEPAAQGSMDGLGGGGGKAPGGGVPMAARLNPLLTNKVVIGAAAFIVVLIIAYAAWPSSTAAAAAAGFTAADAAADAAAAAAKYGFTVSPGRFVVGPSAVSFTEAKTYCEHTYPGGGLASIHSYAEQRQAASACTH